MTSASANGLQLDAHAEWDRLLDAYRAAKAAEDAYDHASGITAAGQDVESIQRAVWDESERLQEIRCEAEDPLMDYPSPDLRAFAQKFLIAYGNDRCASQWDDMLEAEATRLLEQGEAE